jgi:hypothetical protein
LHKVAKFVAIEQILREAKQINVIAQLSTIDIPQAALVIFFELQADT